MKKTALFIACILLLSSVALSQTQRLKSEPKYKFKTKSLTFAPVLLHVFEECITIEFEEVLGTVTVLIGDSEKNIVYNDILDTEESNMFTIDVENWPAGAYSLEIETEESIISGEFEL